MGSERASDVRLKSEEVRIWGVEVRTLKGVEGLMDYKLVHEYWMEAIMRRCNIVDLGIKIKTALPNFAVNCLLGRFYFNCEHFLFVFCKLKTKQKCCGYYKKSWIFKILKNQILLEANFWKLDYSKTFPGVKWGPTKIWARSVQPFWLLLDTNKQTPKQTSSV